MISTLDCIKNILTLFLQLTAIQVLFVTWLPIRKPKLHLSTPIILLNLDLALRSKIYGGSSYLPEILDAFLAKNDNDNERVIIGFRAPYRNLSVIKELSQYKYTDFYGPIRHGGSDDSKLRWASELQSLKWRYGFEDQQNNSPQNVRVTISPLQNFHEDLKNKYDYDLLDFNGKEKSSGISLRYFEDKTDLLTRILDSIEKSCPNNKERVKAY